MNGDLSWMRKNLAIIVAIFSLIATSAGGFASYRLLEQKVAQIEAEMMDRATRNAMSVKETRAVLDNHMQQTASHMDAEKWRMLLDRLDRIEGKVDRLK